MITAKAVQSVLAQLGETDLIVAQWLNNFAAETSPLLGDEFILKMMREVRFALPVLRIVEVRDFRTHVQPPANRQIVRNANILNFGACDCNVHGRPCSK